MLYNTFDSNGNHYTMDNEGEDYYNKYLTVYNFQTS